MVSFRVLGPLGAEDARGPVDLKGPRHRAVLARLLVARGRVVPVDRLLEDLWGEAPEGAVGALQTFVGVLRRALEPDRPPRAPARLLVTEPPGYALRAAEQDVDAWRFEAAVARAGALLAAGDAEAALGLLDEALGLWRGPAYAEVAAETWGRGEAALLEELRLLAVTRRAEAALATDAAAEAVPGLEAHVAARPLHEDGWRLLALALYRTGRQGDALAALRRARATLRSELGVEPGEGLRRLEADVLAQAPRLTAPAAPRRRPRAAPRPGGAPAPAVHPFVGRAAELARLEALAAEVTASGAPRTALVSGTAGVGKTALARALAGRLGAAGWTAAWGTSPEGRGAPADWPWTQMRGALGLAGPEAGPAADGSAPRDPRVARFHRHRATGEQLAAVAGAAPVLLVFDDLHWAGEETLSLLAALAGGLAAGPVLVLGTYRSTELSAGLAEALASVARAEAARIALDGLSEPEVGEVARATVQRELPAGAVRALHERTAGNPFFVRELARLWDAEGSSALHAVPEGVRDVLRQRLAALPERAGTHLRQAAVVGEEVDLDVLVALAADEESVLASVEDGVRAGFLVERDADRVLFAHALVREALLQGTSAGRRARWHAAVADVLEARRPADAGAIADHLLRAGSRVPAARTARWARAAAERAEERSAPHEAARLWRAALAALERAGGTGAHRRLEAVMGLTRALAVTGDLQGARRLRGETLAAAEALGDPVLTAGVIGAFDVPATWPASDDEVLSARVVATAERTLAALPAHADRERARLLAAVALERRADAGPRGAEAAAQAEAIARRLDEPALVALALNGRLLQGFATAGLAARRAAIGEELLSLTTGRGGLVTFEVLAHLVLLQARAALADLPAADRHAAAADLLAERYGLPLVGVLTGWYGALRHVVAGDADGARAAYGRAATRLAGAGMPGMQRGLLPFALLCTSVAVGEPPGPLEGDLGPHAPWARPLVGLDRAGPDEALAASRAIPEAPGDALLEARTWLHATVALRAGDGPAMVRLHARLLPAAGELAGAGSGLLVLGPIAQQLGRLAAALGRTQQAAAHFRQAERVAQRAGAPRWAAAARAALAAS